MQLVTIKTAITSAQNCAGTDVGVQGDDPDGVVSQAHS